MGVGTLMAGGKTERCGGREVGMRSCTVAFFFCCRSSCLAWNFPPVIDLFQWVSQPSMSTILCTTEVRCLVCYWPVAAFDKSFFNHTFEALLHTKSLDPPFKTPEGALPFSCRLLLLRWKLYIKRIIRAMSPSINGQPCVLLCELSLVVNSIWDET